MPRTEPESTRTSNIDFPELAHKIVGDLMPASLTTTEMVEHALRRGYDMGWRAGREILAIIKPAPLVVNGSTLGVVTDLRYEVDESGRRYVASLDNLPTGDFDPGYFGGHIRLNENAAKPSSKPMSAEKALVVLIESDVLEDDERRGAVATLIERLAAML